MALFSVIPRANEWTAIRFHDDRIDLARVRRDGGRPVVTELDSYRKEGSHKDSLIRLRKSLRLNRSRCATLLASDEYKLLQIEAPVVEAAELREAVRWRIKDMLDYPAIAATVDVLNIPGDNAGRPRQVFAVAADNALIAGRMGLFDEAKVPLEVIDIHETAQRNVARLFETENRGLATLAFDDGGGMLTCTCGGELYSSRPMEITAAHLAEADEERRTQLVDRIALELQRSLDNFDRQFSFISLSKLLVAPVPGFADLIPALAANLYVPVEPLDLAGVIDCSAVPALQDPATQLRFLRLIGTALRADGRSQ